MKELKLTKEQLNELIESYDMHVDGIEVFLNAETGDIVTLSSDGNRIESPAFLEKRRNAEAKTAYRFEEDGWFQPQTNSLSELAYKAESAGQFIDYRFTEMERLESITRICLYFFTQ